MSLPRPHRRPWRVAAASLAVVAALGVAACGGDDDEPVLAETTDMTVTDTSADTTIEAPPAGEVTTDAEGNQVVDIPVVDRGLAFAVEEITVEAGTVTLRSVNPQGLPHNIAIDNPEPVEGEVVMDGGVSEITVDLEPGTYEYYCSVPGHREGGMVGTLIVE